VTVLFRQVYVYDADAPDARTGPVDVLVEGDRVSAIGAHLAPAGVRIVEGGGRHLLVPGLINAHFHSPANHLKGAVRSLPLELFMLYESPADPALIPTPREAYLRTMLGAIEMLQRGVTTVQDDAFLMPYPDPQIIDAVASAYRDSGIRAFLALDQPELTEAEKLPFTTELDETAAFHLPAPADADVLLDAYDHLIGTWHGAADDRIRAAVSISAPQRVSLDYFAALDDLAERYRLPLYAHMLETKTQRTLITEQPRFAGRSLVQFTADAGLLKPHTNVIHAVWVDDGDLDAIAEAGSTVVHNPVSNLRLGAFNGLHLTYAASANTPARCIVYTEAREPALAQDVRRAGAFYEVTDRLPVTLLAYLAGDLSPADRRDPAASRSRAALPAAWPWRLVRARACAGHARSVAPRRAGATVAPPCRIAAGSPLDCYRASSRARTRDLRRRQRPRRRLRPALRRRLPVLRRLRRALIRGSTPSCPRTAIRSTCTSSRSRRNSRPSRWRTWTSRRHRPTATRWCCCTARTSRRPTGSRRSASSPRAVIA